MSNLTCIEPRVFWRLCKRLVESHFYWITFHSLSLLFMCIDTGDCRVVMWVLVNKSKGCMRAFQSFIFYVQLMFQTMYWILLTYLATHDVCFMDGDCVLCERTFLLCFHILMIEGHFHNLSYVIDVWILCKVNAYSTSES